MKTKLILMAAVALALGGCNRHDADTQSRYSHLTGAETALITQPVIPDRGPIPADANAAAPGTDASAAFAAAPAEKPATLPRESTTPPDHVDVAAQDAAAKAPDTATADEQKRRVHEGFANGEAAPRETVARAPTSTPPTHEEESRQQ